MITNPLWNIHTDYVPYDIFKPQDANALAQSVPYDYVITKEMVDTYRTEHSLTYDDWIDVGALLWGDGASVPLSLIGRPAINIYINYNTTVNDRFAFHGGLSALIGVSITQVHIYSLSSYRAGGASPTVVLHHHTSGSENYVLFDGGTLHRGAALYVGSFACNWAATWPESGQPFIYEQCVSGDLPTTPGGTANVQQRAWMSNSLDSSTPTPAPGAVRYDVGQSLTEQEQAQARSNIGADIINFDIRFKLDDWVNPTTVTCDKTSADIAIALANGYILRPTLWNANISSRIYQAGSLEDVYLTELRFRFPTYYGCYYVRVPPGGDPLSISRYTYAQRPVIFNANTVKYSDISDALITREVYPIIWGKASGHNDVYYHFSNEETLQYDGTDYDAYVFRNLYHEYGSSHAFIKEFRVLSNNGTITSNIQLV